MRTKPPQSAFSAGSVETAEPHRWCWSLGTRERLLAIHWGEPSLPPSPGSPGEKPLIVWDCKLGLQFTWTSPAPPAHGSGLSFGSSISHYKAQGQPLCYNTFRLFGLIFSTLHNSTASCSEYFPTSGIWFWRSFFCLSVHWFYMKAWHYLSNKKMEAQSIKFLLWRGPSVNAVPSVADTAGNKVN